LWKYNCIDTNVVNFLESVSVTGGMRKRFAVKEDASIRTQTFIQQIFFVVIV
jgi:hypothetical protein